MLKIFLFFTAVLGLVLLLFKAANKRSTRSGKTLNNRAKQQTKAVSQHAAVSIRKPMNACAAAIELGDRRFLAKEAPMLPLDNCDAAQCKCRYRHYKDRRYGDDRRHPYQHFSQTLRENNRQDKDRRKSA